MCSRIVNKLSWTDIVTLYNLKGFKPRKVSPRYNIAPTQDILICFKKGHDIVVEYANWSLLPKWAKKRSPQPSFNVRGESPPSKPSIRSAFASGRCLIPVSGYYVWTKNNDGHRQPWFLHLPDNKPINFAGLFTVNHHLGITSCAVLTVPASSNLCMIDQRMPVVLREEVLEPWLNKDTTAKDARGLLQQHKGDQLIFHRVDPQINSSTWAGGREAISPI